MTLLELADICMKLHVALPAFKEFLTRAQALAAADYQLVLACTKAAVIGKEPVKALAGRDRAMRACGRYLKIWSESKVGQMSANCLAEEKPTRNKIVFANMGMHLHSSVWFIWSLFPDRWLGYWGPIPEAEVVLLPSWLGTRRQSSSR